MSQRHGPIWCVCLHTSVSTGYIRVCVCVCLYASCEAKDVFRASHSCQKWSCVINGTGALSCQSHSRTKKKSEKRKNKHKTGKTLKTKESVSKMKGAYWEGCVHSCCNLSVCVYLLLCNTHTHSALCFFRECRTRQNLHTGPRWLEHTQYTRVEPVRQHLLVLHQKHDRVLSWGSFIILLHPWILYLYEGNTQS